MKTFNIDDTAVILIDHQIGTNTWASTTPLPLLQRNVIILAKFAKGTSYCQMLCMGLGGDPLFNKSIHKFHSSNNFSEALRVV